MDDRVQTGNRNIRRKGQLTVFKNLGKPDDIFKGMV